MYQMIICQKKTTTLIIPSSPHNHNIKYPNLEHCLQMDALMLLEESISPTD